MLRISSLHSYIIQFAVYGKEKTMTITSSVRLMFIPNLDSPGSGVNSSGTSAIPGRYHSLTPCADWLPT